METCIITSRGEEGIEVWLYRYEGGEKQSGRSFLQAFSQQAAAKAYAEREANRRSQQAAQFTTRPSWLRLSEDDEPHTSRSAWVW